MRGMFGFLAALLTLQSYAVSSPPVEISNPFQLPLEFSRMEVDPETLLLEMEMINVSALPVTGWSLLMRTRYRGGEESVARLDVDLFLSAHREEQELMRSPSARIPAVREGRGAFWPGQTLRTREGTSIDPERTGEVERLEVVFDALVFSDGSWMGDEERVDIIFGFRQGFAEGLRHFGGQVEQAIEEAVDSDRDVELVRRLIERLENFHVSPSGPHDRLHGGFMNARRVLISDLERLLREVEEDRDPQTALDELLNVIEEEAQASDQHGHKGRVPEQRKEW